ncbi:MAG: glycosyltransferase family 2 protein [Bacteroidales bacterium]
MGFADGYLQKPGSGERIISENPRTGLKNIIAIPAYNESGLNKCLDSLFLCDPPGSHSEVIVLINSSETSSHEIVERNRLTHRKALQWVEEHLRDDIRFHIVLKEGLPAKHFGAGLARKLAMDEAVRRFNMINQDGIILSLDADTTVRKDYLAAVADHFVRTPGTDGCSVSFEHPLEGNEFPQAVYDAIVNYELHQRYYIQAVRYTGYPYAHHTVGSAFAVKASACCRQGGMSKRKAGEDFYFIQKVAMQGHYTDCTSTRVFPSPRPSDRVPFGTGPDIARQIDNPDAPYMTSNPELFTHLRALFGMSGRFYRNADPSAIKIPLLKQYLDETGFLRELQEIRSNVASEATFKQRFYRKFNMFRILKYIHWAEGRGVSKCEISEAARTMLQLSDYPYSMENKRALLEEFRNIQYQPFPT